MSTAQIDPRTFRNVLGQFCTGITVITTVHDGFFRRAGEQPSAPAVYHPPDGVYHSRGQLTYRELAAQALAVAAALIDLGVAPGDVVAVLGPKGVQQIPAVLGIHAAGAAYLPIGTDQPVDRARRILDTAAVAAALWGAKAGGIELYSSAESPTVVEITDAGEIGRAHV